VTVVTRKAFGGAYIAMNARALGATKVFAWPDAQVAVMGAVAAVRILHRRKLAEVPADARTQVENELAEEHTRIAGGVEKAVAIGVVDEVVTPQTTRGALARALADALAADPDIRGHHGNIPL
jgi:acetyl-CoA/propionyl-CoA carboxylase carboxyl transferase subunit